MAFAANIDKDVKGSSGCPDTLSGVVKCVSDSESVA